MSAFRRASAVYKKKYGKPPVIIYDNISQIVNENHKNFDILQDDAKKNADDRKYIAVHIYESIFLSLALSDWSRANKWLKSAVLIGGINGLSSQ
ncbi:13798_t:CDS:2 [Acaulospora morrowiae]|uniref:13798_t:CDS:1 n=1 Tax=Acaulospora morrowiae TaxID=94023 RepID=A0A9N8VXB0_9GLOM|nr:13798_t:CDS:2 [Acaulospora morrowiae]